VDLPRSLLTLNLWAVDFIVAPERSWRAGVVCARKGLYQKSVLARRVPICVSRKRNPTSITL